MTKKKFHKWCGRFLVFAIFTAYVSCTSSSSVNVSSLPDITTFITTPSDQFLLDSDGMAKVARSSPYAGAQSGCAHTGAHVHFTNTGAPYTKNIYAVADGTVASVETCYDNGDNDRYGVALAIASSNGDEVDFDYSIEPMGGKLCSTGDANYFAPYILVTEGQIVTKGQVIAQFLKTDTGDDAAHIHFDLSDSNGFACPNIFNSTIVSSVTALYTGTCNGTAFTMTLCYLPSSGEDLTGL